MTSENLGDIKNLYYITVKANAYNYTTADSVITQIHRLKGLSTPAIV